MIGNMKPACRRVNVSVPPEVLNEWDKRAKEMHTTRSGFIVYIMQLTEAFTSNRHLKRTFEKIIRDVLKKEMKEAMK